MTSRSKVEALYLKYVFNFSVYFLYVQAHQLCRAQPRCALSTQARGTERRRLAAPITCAWKWEGGGAAAAARAHAAKHWREAKAEPRCVGLVSNSKVQVTVVNRARIDIKNCRLEASNFFVITSVDVRQQRAIISDMACCSWICPTFCFIGMLFQSFAFVCLIL